MASSSIVNQLSRRKSNMNYLLGSMFMKSRYNLINNLICTQQSRSLSQNIDVTLLKMPSLSPTMTQGTVASWKAKPGDHLRPGDILCEIETDKASVGFEMQDEGVLAKILVEAHGPEVICGEPIALIVETVEDYQKFQTLDQSVFVPPKTAAAPPVPIAAAKINSHPTPTISTKIAPSARFHAQSNNLDLQGLRGTGKGGMIIKQDVVSAIKARQSQEEPISAVVAPVIVKETVVSVPEVKHSVTPSNFLPVNARYTDIPNSTMRKVIAKRLTESKQSVPHFYTVIECNIDSITNLRKRLKQNYDINVSVNDLVIKAAALALRDVPEANARWSSSANTIQKNSTVDISVAVATPNGLITPIVTSADKRGIVDINAQIKDLAGRAKAGKLKPEEFQGGTFSVSNLGMFGVSVFSAVINPPQACILAVGGGIPRVVPPTGKETKPRVTTTVAVQLSADRRVLDEAIAAQFLQVFRAYLGDADTLMM